MMAALPSEAKVDVVQATTTTEANVIVPRANEARIDKVRMERTGINGVMSVRTAVIEVEAGEINLEGGYARAAKVEIIREKEDNVLKIGVDEVMANTDVEFILTTNSAAEMVDPVDTESPCHSRRKGGDRRIPMKRGHFEDEPIQVMDNNKSVQPSRHIVSNLSSISSKKAAILPPPSKRGGSCWIHRASITKLDEHDEEQDACNPDDHVTPPPSPCQSEVMQTALMAAEEGKQSGVRQLYNSTKKSVAEGVAEDDDGGCVLHDILAGYISDSAEPSDDGDPGETKRVLLALETATPLATSASTVATQNCGVGMRLNQEMLVETMRPGGPLESCGKIILGDRLVRVDDIYCANLEMEAIKDLVLGKVGSKVSLHFTRDAVVVTVYLHRATAPAPHLNMSKSPMHPLASEARGAYSSNQAPRASVPAHRDAIHNRDRAKICPKYDPFTPSDHPQLFGTGMSLSHKLYHDDPTQRPSWNVSSMSAAGPLATSGKVRVGDGLVRVSGLDCQDWNLQRIKNEVLGKEGSEVRLVFDKFMGSERVELLGDPTPILTLVTPVEASWRGNTPDAANRPV